MTLTHDYETETKQAQHLNSTDVLVGECGGLSAVVGDVYLSGVMPGCVAIETEHGTLYVEDIELVIVLAEFQ